MKFRIICVSSLINLTFRHYMYKFIEKMNALWYEKQAMESHRQFESMNRVGELMPVKVTAGVRVQIVGVAS